MLHIAPDLVLPIEQAGSGCEKKFKIKGLKEGWVSTQRQWTKISEDTGVGNPELATKQKGAEFLNEVVKKIAGFFEEFHNADLNDMYQ